jgi:hypothetical protein
MTAAGQFRKGAGLDSVALMPYDEAKGAGMGLCLGGQPEFDGFRTADAKQK